MTLRKQIAFSFIVTLVLFALNFGIDFWIGQKKSATIEMLQQATSRQALTLSIKQAIGDAQRQVARLGQIRLDTAATSLPAKEIEQANLQSAKIAAQIAALQKLSNDAMRAKVDALQTSYSDLTASWHIFYESFGINHVQALAELALHTEPLSQRILYEIIPLLEESEKLGIQNANKGLDETQWWTGKTAAIVFLLSLCIVLAITLLSYRRLARGLNALKQNMDAAKNGDSEHRISLPTHDEMGEIASTFNHLADTLHTTQDRLSQLDQTLLQQQAEIETQRQAADAFLHNILPVSVADEFRIKGSVEPKYLEDVTIIFTDFVGFSSLTEKLAAEDLVRMLHEYFSIFDEITARYGLEKLKTIGDSYMCAGGLPERNPSHPVDAVMAAMEIIHAVTERNSAGSQNSLAIRVGIHTGHLIAGMVGKKKFTYDIWGESVNYASRLESSSEPNQITLSEQTQTRVKDFFECQKLSKVLTKSNRKLDAYTVTGLIPSLIDDSKQIPPQAFLRRYRSYFQKDPPSFPAFLSRLLP